MFKFLKRLRGEKDLSVESEPQEKLAVKEAAGNVTASELPGIDSASIHEEKTQEAEQPSQALAAAALVTAQAPSGLEAVELPSRSLGKGVRSLFGDAVEMDELEDILILADFGVETAEEIAAQVKKEAGKQGATTDAELRLLLKDLLTERLIRKDSSLNLEDGKLPYVFLVVGVNGAGKTTTIGKLARWLKDGQWEVVLGAADTYRAAAVDQLATWAERAESPIVRPAKEGADPAAVAYQTVEMAINTAADIAIIDTAGRLQNKKDLMDELGKIRRAVEKQSKISEVLLVIDATNGQNAMSQAKAFTEVADVTGIVMTKLDGTAKGGILYALQKELNLPIKLVGVGEQINDFAFFSPEEFAKGLVAKK
ncbi:signal recognition particle-docking protein FtsY [Aquiluna sp.]|nr:signal recognition particle-docking protein FtsY [Aquiluna sp.]MDA9010588.1 signal recognition particle-docking protein FtsY [Aquiluna sp.]